ncbi:MAG: CDP-diacylglycerol--glycerol-3-phosphate 3-phosphatidyltransferase [Coriobacteriales bacterium]|jgi:CDP-diacylglycerol--glycerol-3-phosphate 3-phosphatidyltransferase|nr:CDP-diacylglycerol--glycerol-3-phosphate 3-phosphatidyltransferase [Coriobacteriales bacterium]
MPDEGRYRELMTPANIVTTVRIVLIPVFVFLLLAPWPQWVPDPLVAQMVKPLVAAAVFALLALTDGLDGYLARSRNEVTNLGKFLDPLADKILVTAALLALIELGALPAWVALVIIGRDFLVSGIRMVASVERQVIAASPLGKAKTVLQIVAVILFIVKGGPLVQGLGPSFVLAGELLAWGVMVAALVLTLLSMAEYLWKSASLLGLPLSVGKGRADRGTGGGSTEGGGRRDGGRRDGGKGAGSADREKE